jgi:hypothetical protein
MSAPSALLLDEGQRLAPHRRRRLFASIVRQGRSLAVASHTDLSDELWDAGLSCRTQSIAGLDAEQLLAIVQRRVAWARLPEFSPAIVTCSEAERLIGHFGDNISEILNDLYERYQLAAMHQE